MNGVAVKKGDIKGAAITLGGSENGDGVQKVLDASGNTVVQINADGILVQGTSSKTSNLTYTYGNTKVRFQGDIIIGSYNGSRRFIIQCGETGGAGFDGNMNIEGDLFVEGNIRYTGNLIKTS